MDLKLAVLLSRLRIMVLGRPPLSEKTPGIVAVVGVGRIRRRSRHRRHSVRGLTGPRKRTKTVVQNESIGKSEQFIITSRRCRSHLMRRRRWLAGMFSSGISSAAHLPWLSSLAIGSTRRGKGCYRVCRGGGVQRNKSGCKCSCVRGWSPRLVFEATERRGGHLGMCKRQPQLIEGEVPPH